MGMFSWITKDTKRSIYTKYSERNSTFTVYMHDDEGNVWKEDSYEGYGEFGGKDYFELLAEMNGFPSDRMIGIDINRTPKCKKYPILTERKKYNGLFNVSCDNCPTQGA